MEHKEAKDIIAKAAFEMINDLLEELKGARLTDSHHFHGVKSFYNETQKDLDIAYKAILTAAIHELIDEFNSMDGLPLVTIDMTSLKDFAI